MDLLEDIFKAYYDARREKRNSPNQLRFEMNLEENLISLYREIKERRYRIGPSTCFIIETPVRREIFAAGFRDRVVHHLVHNYISPLFERIFIPDCYSCRKGKGTLYGIERLEQHIRRCSHNYTQEAYVLQLDIQGFFMHINREILYKEIMRKLESFACWEVTDGIQWKDSEAYGLIRYLLPIIVFHNPTTDCIRKSPPEAWDELPLSKSLFHSPEGCGLPIGNLTSQLFSNIYLNPFDHYVKHILRAKHYGRYVDDFYLVDTNHKRLLGQIPIIRHYLWDTLRLTLHPNKIRLQSYRKGVPFLGAMVKPYRRYIENRTKKNFRNVLYRWEHTLGACQEQAFIPKVSAVAMRASLNSYLGLMKHCRTFRLRKEMLFRALLIYRYGYFANNLEKFVLRNHGIYQ